MREAADLVRTVLQRSIDTKAAILADEALVGMIVEMSREIVHCLEGGGKVMFAGNGGSFADSIHLAAELVWRLSRQRRALAALALGANSSVVSAIGNDCGFDDVFAREIEALGRAGDVLVAISTSGNSENILRAVRAALERNITVFGLTGETGGKMASECRCFKVPSSVTARIQEAHATVGHIICEIAEDFFAREQVP
jgi:D-sedoheptulose 7-phosphate isomerase